jgi:hypothetical protein
MDGIKWFFETGLRIRIRIGSGLNRVRGSGSRCGIRIYEGKKDQQNCKIKKYPILKYWMFSFEGLKASPVA